MADRGDSVWDRWEIVDQLLERVLDLPPEERESFLARECTDDPDLARMVASLAQVSSSAESEPLGPGSEILKAVLAEGPPDAIEAAGMLVGTTVGSYRLTGQLGAGGMGTVFNAERADDAFEKTVAIKILKQSVNTPGVAERFRQERQILASLCHPAIAQILDGGVTDDGRPFFVMERVDGAPIGQYADQKELDVDGRIQLILKVAEAVEFAHRHMVVHRDLKPSNILVREDGAVKLLDFGIAKVLEGPGSDPDAVTRIEARFVTPEYAAPEQLLGEPVSAQTDVYSLTALLYELLTSVRPYARGADPSVLERVVEGAEPTAPSAAIPPANVNTEGALKASSLSLAGVYAARGTTPDALRRRLSGDLDAILMRGLRARPSDRYPSVRALRDDLERHLAGEAVTARGDAWSYRAGKFTSRHRTPLVIAAAVFLLTAGSAAGLAVQRGNLIEERNRAEAASTLAARESETARQVTTFLTELFQGSDPSERLGDTVTARALLERGTVRLDQDLATQPAVRAELLGVLGRVYTNLGDFDQGIALHTRATAIRRDSLEGQDGLAVALLALGSANNVAREFADSRSAYAEATVSAAATHDTLTLAYAHLGMGRALRQLEMTDSAEFQLRTGLKLLDRVSAETDEARLQSMGDLAGILRRRGDLTAADSIYGAAVTRRRALKNGNPVSLSTALNDLAIVRRLRGDLESAEELYREAIDSLDAVLGPGNPRAQTLRGNLVTTLVEAEKWDEAILATERSADVARDAWPDGHWRVGTALMQLGGTLIRADRASEAVEPLQEAVEVMTEHLGANHSWTDVTRAWLGTANALSGRTQVAEELFATSIAGLSTYEGLPQDRTVKGMLGFAVTTMRDKGLVEYAERFSALADLGGIS